MSYLDKVQRCNRRDLARYAPFLVSGVQYGWLTQERAALLLTFPGVFQPALGGVAMNPELTTAAKRSQALARLAPALTGSNLFPKTRGELYAVKNDWNEKEALRMDRALVAGFGVRAYGVHVNGLVQKRSGLHMWIGTRSKDVGVEPGKRDSMVAGGQPAGLTLAKNVVKECAEEAHIPAKLARTAVPTSVMTYCFETANGLKADTLFCYDLAVPGSFTPKPSEEISKYALMPVAKALRLVRSTESFKFNVNLVVIDCAIRHGLITPENEPDFEQIVAGLHERPQPLV